MLKTHLGAVGAELDSLSVLALPSQPSTDFLAVDNHSTPLHGAMKTLQKECGKAPKAFEEAIASDTVLAPVSGSNGSSGNHTSAVVNAVLLDSRGGNWLTTTVQSTDLLPPAAVATIICPNHVIRAMECRNPCSTDSDQQNEIVLPLYCKHKLPEGRVTGEYRSSPAAKEHETFHTPPLRSYTPPFRRRLPENLIAISTAPPQGQAVSSTGHRGTSLMRSSAYSTTRLIGRKGAHARAAKVEAVANLVKRPRSLLFAVALAVFSVVAFYCSYAVATLYMQNGLTRKEIPAAGEGLTIAQVGEGSSFSRVLDRDERIAPGGGRPQAFVVRPREDAALIRNERLKSKPQHVNSTTVKNFYT